MGLTIALETEQGELVAKVEDRKNLLHNLLPTQEDKGFSLLSFIDWYGDTIFNRKQMEIFLSELSFLKNKGISEEEKKILLSIEGLALKCQTELHLYLKFYGD